MGGLWEAYWRLMRLMGSLWEAYGRLWEAYGGRMGGLWEAYLWEGFWRLIGKLIGAYGEVYGEAYGRKAQRQTPHFYKTSGQKPHTSIRKRCKPLTIHVRTIEQRIKMPEPPIRKGPPPIQGTPGNRTPGGSLDLLIIPNSSAQTPKSTKRKPKP